MKGMSGDVEMENASTVMGMDNKDEQNLEPIPGAVNHRHVVCRSYMTVEILTAHQITRNPAVMAATRLVKLIAP